MHYTIAHMTEKYFDFYYKKKIIHCGDGDEAGISEPVGDEDEIRFLIPFRYR